MSRRRNVFLISFFQGTNRADFGGSDAHCARGRVRGGNESSNRDVIRCRSQLHDADCLYCCFVCRNEAKMKETTFIFTFSRSFSCLLPFSNPPNEILQSTYQCRRPSPFGSNL